MESSHFDKIKSLDELTSIVDSNRKEGRNVVQCHGCFDILHTGHLRHFISAKRRSHILIVTLTPDEYINKGPDRPVFPQEQRAELIAGLSIVDFVAVNKWASAVETIKMLKPDLFAKGSEYETRAEQVNPNFLIEKETIESVGGNVIFTYEFTDSSTKAFNKMKAVAS